MPLLRKLIWALAATLLLALPAAAQRQVSSGKAEIRLPSIQADQSRNFRRTQAAIHYAYRIPSFINVNFASRLSAGEVNQLGSHEAGMSFHLVAPLYLDVTAFQDNFSVPDDPDFTEYRLKNFGGEAFLTMEVLPYIPYVSSWLHPYIGIGGTMGALRAVGKTSGDTDASLALNALMFKGGVSVSYSSLFLMAEYKQTFPVTSERLMSVIAIGGGFRF